MKPKHKKCKNGLEPVKSKNEIMKPKYKKCKDEPEPVKSKKEVDEIRKLQLLEANKEEDKEIKRLEKLLKLDKKKKKKKTSTGFFGDDLDYLLDYKNEAGVLSDDSDNDNPSELKIESTSSAPKRKISDLSEERPQSKNRTLTELLKEKEGHVSESEESEELSDQDEDFSESENESLELEDNQDSVSSNDESEPKSKKCKYDDAGKEKPAVWEDIYGRFRDKEGNVIKKTDEVKKYVPPGLRKTAPDDHKQEQLMKIKRTLKGFLNRLSESNLQPISREIEGVYMKYSRNDVNETLFSLVSDLVLTSIQTAPRLIMEQTMLISLLHANVGVEIGAYFLQHLVKKLDSLLQTDNYGEGKLCNNVLTFLSHLYNFKVAHSKLIFDIFRKFIDSFKSKDIELIQLFLKNIGFVLRKDDPTSLKEIILAIQTKASSMEKEENDSRINFMLETLTAIRNNNIYKIPDYDPSVIEHSKKVLKGLLKKDCYLQELAVSYEDLIKAEERGRWWIVGSAWSESDNFSAPKKKEDDLLPKAEFSEKILELAQKLRMNTDIKKSIFCVIMTAEDYIDAFQRLLKLNLKNQQQKEIISVILHCALNEKKYNPYYSYLAAKFCSFSRNYRMTLQFLLWDKFKELNNMKPSQISNLSKFLSHCFNSLVLPLSVLKVITFSEMDKTMLKLIRPILLSILLHKSEERCIEVFKRISNGEQLKFLRDSLNIFMHTFILSKAEKYSPEDSEKLKERVEIAKNALYSAKKMRMF